MGDLLVECKVRDVDKSFRIELEWFDKVREHAQQAGYRDGVVVVNKKGGRKPMVVCDLDFFLDILSQK